MKDHIESMKDLCNYFYADEPDMLNKRIYKGTDCGASISVYLETPDSDPVPEGYELVYSSGSNGWGVENYRAIHNGDPAWRELAIQTPIIGFTIQTIVEGSDATVDSDPFVLPVPKQQVADWMDYMEAEANWLWEEANEELEEEV